MLSKQPIHAFRSALSAGLCLALVAGCRTGANYTEVTAPRYATDVEARLACDGEDRQRGRPDSLLVVSFNVEYAKNVEGATELLQTEAAVRCADIVLLQEMDAVGAEYIAEGLGLSYRYYPAVFSKRTQRDFGNAVLSRWPIVDDAKLLLPHHSIPTGTQRIATAATLVVAGDTVRVYSTHLGTIAEIGPGSRSRQLETIAADAAAYDRVIVGGDMNSRAVGYSALGLGYTWPTEEGPPTTSLGRWDHVFLKGLTSTGPGSAGTVMDVEGVSDHRPVWVIVNLGGRDN